MTRRLIVRGKVQGVSFRDWAVGTASSLGITGWVRNRSDGSVEILASGRSEAVIRFIESCRDGPARAVVEDVASEEAPHAEASSFSQCETV